MSLRPITLIGIVISMVTGIAMGIVGYHTWLERQFESAEARTFDKVLQQVESSYVIEVNKTELFSNALRGMLDNLDDHSNYLDAMDFDQLQAETTGQFGGIGIELGLVDEFFTVISPLDGTPASDAGLQPGDRIIELDHISLRGKKLVDVVQLLRGAPGSDLHMRMLRQSVEEPLDVNLSRAVIEITSVDGHIIEPGYGYIRISQFQTATGEDFAAVLASLLDEADGKLQGLVIDLRNNPGGVLQSSVAVADTFLVDGLIVSTEGRLPSSHLKYRASGRDALDGAPIMVLINRGSASAAEIVAGALQDHKRAKLLGSKSYGKGSVQSVMPISGDHAIKLTTAYYYTPSGRTIHKQGIEPDIVIEDDSAASEHDDLMLSRALEELKQSQDSLTPGLHAKL